MSQITGLLPTLARADSLKSVDALKQAAMALEKLLVSHGVTEDELFQEFRALREGKE